MKKESSPFLSFVSFCVVLLFPVTGHVPVGNAQEEPAVEVVYDVAAYDGKFKGEENFLKRFDDLEKSLQSKIRAVTKQLKVDLSSGGVVHVHLRDYGSDWTQPAQVETTEEGEQKLTLMPAYFLSDRMKLPKTLHHEAVHLVLRLYLGRNVYSQIPEWFQEGIAVYLSEEGPLHVKSELALRMNPGDLLTGLTGKVTISDYPYCYLMVKFIADQKNRPIDRSLIDRIKSGIKNERSVREVISSWMGMKTGDFKSRGDKYVLRQLKNFTGGRKEFKKGRKCYRNEENDRAESVFQEVVNNHFSSPFGGKSMYYLGKLYYRKKEYRKAAEKFRRFIDGHSYSGLVDEAYLYRGLSQFGEENFDAAAGTLRKMTRYFPYANQWDRGRYFFGRTLEELNRKEKSLSIYRSLLGDRRLSETYRRKVKQRIENLE